MFEAADLDLYGLVIIPPGSADSIARWDSRVHRAVSAPAVADLLAPRSSRRRYWRRRCRGAARLPGGGRHRPDLGRSRQSSPHNISTHRRAYTDGLTEHEAFNIPGSILRVRMDTEPLARVRLATRKPRCFSGTVRSGDRRPTRGLWPAYPDRELLMSGWIQGERRARRQLLRSSKCRTAQAGSSWSASLLSIGRRHTRRSRYCSMRYSARDLERPAASGR